MKRREGSVLVDVVLALLIAALWLGPALKLLTSSAKTVRQQEVDLVLTTVAQGLLEKTAGSYENQVPLDVIAGSVLDRAAVQARAQLMMGAVPESLNDLEVTIEMRPPQEVREPGTEGQYPLVLWTLEVRWTDPSSGGARSRRYFRVTKLAPLP
jgi:hypothetical protein